MNTTYHADALSNAFIIRGTVQYLPFHFPQIVCKFEIKNSLKVCFSAPLLIYPCQLHRKQTPPHTNLKRLHMLR